MKLAIFLLKIGSLVRKNYLQLLQSAMYPLMQSAMPAILISIVYITFVKNISSLLRGKRKPYELKYTLIAYNVSMVALHFWMFFKLVYYGWFNNYNWVCEPIHNSINQDVIKILEICTVYFISKFIEFSNKAFMILRKKDAQSAFLHVFHHSINGIWCYYAAKYSGRKYATIIPFLNSLVHTFMYTYDGLAACGSAVQKYLWWKKYLSKMQLLQFVLSTLHVIQIVLLPVKHCKVSNFQAIFIVAPVVIFSMLFMHYYRTEYFNKKVKIIKVS